METADLCALLTGYTLTVAFAAVAEWIRRREATCLITVVVSLTAVAVTTVVGFYLEPGTSYLGLLWGLFTHGDLSGVISMAMGGAAAFVWVVRPWVRPGDSQDGVRASLLRRCLEQTLLAASIVAVVAIGQAFIWKSLLGVQRDVVTRSHAPGFVIQKIADLEYMPLRIATGDDGKVFVSYDYMEPWGDIGGAVVELSPDAETGRYRQRVVADSPLLMRPYGLAYRDGDLFISRSGICPRASHGKVSYENTGTVTQLKDVNNDGYFEYAHDVVTGLPGARGPDTMHQNNGIAFAADGSLFLTSATAANRALDDHPWAGVVLRVSPDFTQTEVYARGFRNSWGIVQGPDGEVFATDNDVDENPGDELNHVVRGAHYGHPYVVPNESLVDASGFRDPILVGEHESNFLGMAYTNSPALPEEYRNCIYMTDYMQNEVLRVTLARAGDTYEVTGVHPLASVPFPVDIAVGATGEFFVISRTNAVYRIEPPWDQTLPD